MEYREPLEKYFKIVLPKSKDFKEKELLNKINTLEKKELYNEINKKDNLISSLFLKSQMAIWLNFLPRSSAHYL